MSTSRPDSPPSPSALNPDQLTGWKEIASYLDKGLRTVQRWEQELGLPVHRIRIRGSETIFAFKSEVDRWRASAEVIRAQAESPPNGSSANDPSNGVADPPAGTGKRSAGVPQWRARALVVAAPVCLLLILLGWWAPWRRERPGGGPAVVRAPVSNGQPATARVVGHRLEISDKAGRFLWDHDFPHPLDEGLYLREKETFDERHLQIVDIDGDGHSEVLIAVKDGAAPNPMTGAVFCFNSDGSTRFEHSVKDAVRFGNRAYEPSFGASGFWIVDEPEGRKSVWVAFKHNQDFPSVIQRLDPREGRVLQQYWSSGHITTFTTGFLDGHRRYFVGAPNNEHLGASLAVFDEQGPRGHAPAAEVRFLCDDCDPEQPLAFFVLPRTEIGSRTGGYPFVRGAAIQGRELVVTVQQSSFQTPEGEAIATSIYRLDAELRITGAEFNNPQYATLHRQLERVRKITHPFGERDQRELWPVLRSSGRGFTAIGGPELIRSPVQK